MPIPTDRGYVVVVDEADGTRTVQVAAAVADGEPVGVYASHVGTEELVIHPEVELLPRDGSSFTEDVVQVFVDENDIVHIAGVQPVPGG